MERCPRGSSYDEGGFCSCGARHEDPAQAAADPTKSLFFVSIEEITTRP